MIDTKRLRQKILDLAICGKLVPQDPADESASVLLERIHAEKLQMVADGKLKKKDVVNDSVIYLGEDSLHYEKIGDGEPVCIEEELPFELPEGWEWARLFALSYEICYGVSNSAEERGLQKLLRITDIQNNRVNWKTVPFTTVEEKKVDRFLLKENDILFARTGATVGKSYRAIDVPSNAVFASYLIRVRLLWCSPRYVENYFGSAFYWSQITDKSVGIGQPNVNGTSLGLLLIPIPPLAEQERIVAKLDELLGLVDRIENEQTNLEELFKKLRSKVLDLAIRGKLVPQDPADEPASVLLERIHAEKLQMVADGKLKKKDVAGDSVIYRGDDNSYYEKIGDGDPFCIDDELPFELPDGWAWSRLGSLCEYLHRGKTPKYSDVRKYPVFAQKCNQPTHITLEKVKFADPTSISRYGDECYLRDDDIVVNSTGAGTLGRVGLFHETILGAWPCIVPDSHVTTIRCVNRLFAPYVYRLLKSPVGQWLISSKQTGSTNQKELPATEVARFLVPVPPIKEQRRISTQTEVTLRALGV